MRIIIKISPKCELGLEMPQSAQDAQGIFQRGHSEFNSKGVGWDGVVVDIQTKENVHDFGVLYFRELEGT